MIVFEVNSVMHKKIRLTGKILKLIILKHVELIDEFSKIKETLVKSNFVIFDERENTYHYYKFFPQTVVTEKYMHIIVKHLNEEGFVITAFFTKEIKKGRVIWLKE